MKLFKGIANNISAPVIGIVTRNPWTLKRKDCVLVTEDDHGFISGFGGIIAMVGDKKTSLPTIQAQKEDLRALTDGDCVSLNQDGTVRVVWEEQSSMNALLLTEACDCKCMMCPQPPKPHDKSLVVISRRILGLVKTNASRMICLTGGEPTLLKEEFFNILRLIDKKCPEASTMLLTNGKSFTDYNFTKKFIASKPKNLEVCVSLHSDVDEVHDQIVGVKGSFYKTAMGLQNLARFRQAIEIRVVINKLNFNRLESIANFIIRNFPFINHCAFMGMEVTGYARDNFDSIWIDPTEYKEQLQKAVKIVSRANLNVSIYNIPLCLLERKAWGFAKKSISGWKNAYLPVCEPCSVKSECGGVFTTSGAFQSCNIHSLADA